jgi:hypothetical protein
MEFDAMQALFNDTFVLTVPKWGPLYWTGAVEINMQGVPQRHHKIQIIYPDGFPYRPPEAYVREPRGLYSEKHQFEDGQLCLFNPKDGENYGWNPTRSTAATIAGWAIQWLYAYYTWRSTGSWPGVEERIISK